MNNNVIVSNDSLNGGSFEMDSDALAAWEEFGHLIVCENPF